MHLVGIPIPWPLACILNADVRGMQTPDLAQEGARIVALGSAHGPGHPLNRLAVRRVAAIGTELARRRAAQGAARHGV